MENITHNLLSSVRFSTEDILHVMNDLDSNKTNVHDKIRIKILEIYRSLVSRPFETIWKSCLVKGKFLLDFKKLMLYYYMKKSDKQSVIDCFSIWGKIFLHNSVLDFLI